MLLVFVCIVVVGDTVVEIGLCVIDLIEFCDDECFAKLLSVELIASIKAGVVADGSFDVVRFSVATYSVGCASSKVVDATVVDTVELNFDATGDSLLAFP